MAVVVYPLDSIEGAPSYTGRMLRETLAVILGGATASRPLGIRSGVRPGTPSTTISISGTTVTIGEHAGAVDVEAAAEAGPYLYAVNAAWTQVLDAANATNPRTDAFGIQISDPAESDGTSVPGGALVYKAGDPGPGAPMPTLPARFMLLGTASVPKSGAGSPTVTWAAPTLTAAGGVMNFSSTAERNTATSAGLVGPGQLAWVGSVLQQYNGSGWDNITPRVGVVPTSVTNGSSTRGGYVTSSAVGSVSLNGCFSSEFDSYEITFDISMAAAATLNLLLRAAGSDDTSASYDTQRLIVLGSTVGQAQHLNQANWIGSGTFAVAGARHVGKLTLFKPAAAAPTFGRIESLVSTSPMSASSGLFYGGVEHQKSVAYDGITFAASTGNLTVNELRVEGISAA
jgi:hypothetical protein